jgi:plasmid stabilization system protein ParE
VALEVRFLPEAEEDLFDIYAYVVENGGLERANGYDRRLAPPA